mmetsp:Transcript_14845/g.18588  ORF Transcript_14845/g.18588 Transcript_14845/m.18588 type:complete len:172 (+) Transcript_14845:1366-1881(+)
MEESKEFTSQGNDTTREENTSADLFNNSTMAATAAPDEELLTADLFPKPAAAKEQEPAEEETKEEEAANPAAALALRKARRKTISNAKNVPHFTNLNEDPQMSGIVYTSLQKGEILIGRKTADPQPDIILGAIGIQKNHGKITLKANGLFELSVVGEAAISTFVNGEPLTV